MILNRIVAFRLMQRFGFVPKGAKKVSGKKSLLFGLTLFSLAAFLFVFWEELLDAMLNWQMQLKDGNLMFAAWKELPFPLQIKVHVFQITNGREFGEGRAWPKVTDVGPFYFHEYRKRDIHSWSKDNGVVKYYEHMRFEFDESRSVAPLSQLVTVINAPLLLILGFVESKVNDFYLSMFAPIISNVLYMIFVSFKESLVERRTVGDVLNGREVGVLHMVDAMSKPLKTLGIDVPVIGVGLYKLSESSFGFIKLRNNQTFGPVEVYTGQTTAGQFNSLYSVEGRTSLAAFRHPRCNQLKGTEGTFFGIHPPAGSNASLYIFNQHLCRPLKFLFEKKSSAQWMNTLRYVMDHQQFSIVAQPENWCFCPKDEPWTRCEGVLFMRQCLDGAPLALSNPHFLNTPQLLAKVNGLQPDPEKHIGYLEVERLLGTATEVAVRVQLNIDMKPVNAVNSLRQFRPVIMPYIWIDEGAVIEGHLKYIILVASHVMYLASEGFILIGALGGLLMLQGCIKMLLRKIKQMKIVDIANNEDTDNIEDNAEKPQVQKTHNPPDTQTQSVQQQYKYQNRPRHEYANRPSQIPQIIPE